MFGSFDPAAMLAAARKVQEDREKLRTECEALIGFCPFDLGQWLDLAAAAGVPMVPATVVASGSTALWNDDDLSALNAIVNEARAATAASPTPVMLRWSWGSHGHTKHHVNGGQRDWHEDLVDLYAEDSRSFDMQASYPLQQFAIYMRPWLQLMERRGAPRLSSEEALLQRERDNHVRLTLGKPLETGPLPTYDRFGLEVRVYVYDNAIQGVSAYYPQCPLDPEDAEARRLFEVARASTQKLIDAQTKVLVLPQMPEAHGTHANAWTADFVMTADRQILLLEGGPPHLPTFGAHPCCFQPGQIAGDAYTPQARA